MWRKGMRILIVLGMVGTLMSLAWLVVSRAAGIPAVKQTEPAADYPGEPAYILQETTPMTVYLPLVARNYPPPPPVFGIEMSSINHSRGLTYAIAADMHWVRFNTFFWDKIEPVNTTPSNYDWSTVDEESLRNAAENSLEVIATVKFTPDWAQKVEGSYCGPIKQDALDDFAQFLTALVNRYSASPYNVKYWEMGNEPDAAVVKSRRGYGCWGDPNDAYYGGGYYAEMLKVAYPAIKAADPQAKVLIGGLLLDCDYANPPEDETCLPSKFLDGILRNEGGDYFDIVSFHGYTYYGGNLGEMGNTNWPGSTTVVPEKTAFIRRVLKQYGYEDKSLINTEAAQQCSEVTEDCLETQGIYVARAYAEAMALELKGQIYFKMINEHWRHTGLLQPDLTPKPAYDAYQVAASYLSAANYKGGASYSGVEGYTFRSRKSGDYIDVLWTEDGTSQSVTLPNGAVAYDRYGDPIASSGSIQVDYSPVYIVRP
jgi:hypothetical protein